MNSKFNIILLRFLTIDIIYIQGGPIQSDSKKGDSSSESNEHRCNSTEYYTCGPTCIETCDYKPEICTQDCKYGCFCKEGYVRQSNETDCPCSKKQDGNNSDNEEYTTCGTACPETCDYKPKWCTKQCVKGCFCKPNYVRKDKSKNSRCISQELC